MVKRKQKHKILEEMNRLKELMISNRKDREFSNYIAKEIKSISLRTRTRLGKEIRALICKKCGNFLFPGLNVRIRTRNKKVIYYCKNCKNIRRIG